MTSPRFGRLRRLATAAALCALIGPALPAAPAAALPPAPPVQAPVPEPAPHLDAVESVLRDVSPGLEGQVWERTGGNALDTGGGGASDWLLQTPGCWGDAGCADRPGSRQLLARMTENISRATTSVDISTLAPFPDGAFQDAIVAGLKQSVAAGHRLSVRVLAGAAPIYHLNVLPSAYRDQLRAGLGEAAGSVTLNVATMTTSKTGLSWNHSKLLVVDGQSVITGGINGWKNDYLTTTHPVSDADLALSGPAARSASRYLDRLWSWTCERAHRVTEVWFAASPGAGCLASLEKALPPLAATGNVPVIAVGGLGVGVQSADPSSSYRPALSTTAPASDTTCLVGLHDHTNTDRDYDTVNPEESALRALVGSARSHIEISQQDLHATCPPLPRYDVRLYDTLAARMAAGVKVRIVVSDPANRGAIGSGGYSQITSLKEISDALRNRLALTTKSVPRAEAVMCATLQLATARHSGSATWADGHPYAQHHKLVSVDGSAFYLGSKNLYPSWLQDYGYIVESPAAAAQLADALLAPQWAHSRATATYDHTRAACPLPGGAPGGV
ncbi:phospholipase [Streptomyces sp. LP05-1]|uniref:Phospholipase n=1 Tax=Streptomyces pyxinae TaxID=2970734 RepID=A0ABT2CGZ2_9ACTN|nr:phospholipase [Streptomyces sp. LP05-1]MCS0636687.1 phospholipase [Streptomyces sp. LP05-1]